MRHDQIFTLTLTKYEIELLEETLLTTKATGPAMQARNRILNKIDREYKASYRPFPA